MDDLLFSASLNTTCNKNNVFYIFHLKSYPEFASAQPNLRDMRLNNWPQRAEYLRVTL